MTDSNLSNPLGDTDVQAMLRNSVQRLLERHYTLQARKTIIEGEEGWSRDMWRELADLGLLALAVPEESGGIGTTLRDIWIVAEQMGRHLVIEPFAEVAVVAAALIAALDTSEARGSRLESIFEGRSISVLADGGAADDGAAVENADISAKRVGHGYVLSGVRTYVVGAPWADELLILASLEGETAIFSLDPTAHGVRLRAFRTLDGRACAHIYLDAAEVESAALLGTGERADQALRHAALLGLVANAGEATGIMRRAVDASVEHARTREQFGQPIGKFQALQHRLVDMHVAQREVSALGEVLTAMMERLGSENRETARYAAALRSRVAESGQAVGEAAIQIHGGMGMSEELPVGAMLRRLRAIAIQQGGVRRALDDFLAAS